MEQVLKQKFCRLLNALSPENLHCDGEISNSQAKKQERRLMKEWRELEKELGKKISPYELESQLIKEYQQREV